MRFLKIFVAFITLANCCACGNDSLVGCWEVRSITGVEDVSSALNQPFITLRAGKTFSGNSGVNTIFGSYKASCGKISFGKDAGMTKMMGDSLSMVVEDAYMDVINQACRYSVAEDKCLVLSNEDGSKVMILSKKE